MSFLDRVKEKIKDVKIAYLKEKLKDGNVNFKELKFLVDEFSVNDTEDKFSSFGYLRMEKELSHQYYEKRLLSDDLINSPLVNYYPTDLYDAFKEKLRFFLEDEQSKFYESKNVIDFITDKNNSFTFNYYQKFNMALDEYKDCEVINRMTDNQDFFIKDSKGEMLIEKVIKESSNLKKLFSRYASSIWVLIS